MPLPQTLLARIDPASIQIALAVTRKSRSSPTGSIDNSPCGIFLTSDARLPDVLPRRLADFVSSAGVNKRAAEAARGWSVPCLAARYTPIARYGNHRHNDVNRRYHARRIHRAA